MGGQRAHPKLCLGLSLEERRFGSTLGRKASRVGTGSHGQLLLVVSSWLPVSCPELPYIWLSPVSSC